jgi:hypothetical protein
MQKLIVILGATFALLFTASCGNTSSTEQLCDCVNNQEFIEKHILTKECIALCIDKFGEELTGMEQWFDQNCPNVQKPNYHHEHQNVEQENDEGVWL